MNIIKKRKLPYIADSVVLSFKYIPFYSIAIIILNILDGIIPLFQIAVTTKFIDSALKAVNNGLTNDLSKEIYLQIFLLILITAYYWTISKLKYLFIITKANLILRKKYRTDVLEKCSKLEYKFIEDASTWDLISRMTRSPESQILNIFCDLMNLISTIIAIVGITITIVIQVWWAAIAIVVCCAPLFWFSVKSGKANYDAQRSTEKITRKHNYLSSILVNRECADEKNLFGYSEKVNEKFYNEYKIGLEIRVKTLFKWFVKTKLGGALTVTSGALVVLILLNPTIQKVISIGLFISLVNAVFSLTGRMSWGLSRQIDTLVQGREFMKDMEKLMNLSETEGALDKPVYTDKVNRIEFDNVSFTYPGTETEILKNVSFVLDNGRHYAFVGANGAGKTTIIKLLTGLYTNYTGEIRINGKELRSYDFNIIKGFFSIVYQDFVKHSFTLKENCMIGDMNILENNPENRKVHEALCMVGLDKAIKDLPKGIDTNLGKIHNDGVDLSGGQWQRLSMSRAIISLAPVRILDEPTAALDPVTESNIYKIYDKISGDHLTIFISHRLGSTKISDEIIVFDNGTIKEYGTHEKLMELKGLYFEMFEQQRSWYQ